MGLVPYLVDPHLRNLKASLLLIARPLSSMYSKLTVGLYPFFSENELVGP